MKKMIVLAFLLAILIMTTVAYYLKVYGGEDVFCRIFLIVQMLAWALVICGFRWFTVALFVVSPLSLVFSALVFSIGVDNNDWAYIALTSANYIATFCLLPRFTKDTLDRMLKHHTAKESQ